MKKIKPSYIFILVFIILFIILFILLKDIFNNLKTPEVKTLSMIENYNYTLNENDSPYFKEIFNELKETLDSEEVDEDKYAELLSKAFVIDFYSLQYAISKSDVGGIQFVYSEYQPSFVNKAKDTIYAYVENNVYGKRNQELPNIKTVDLKEIKTDVYEGEKEKDEKAYYITLSLEYEEDLGYDKEVSLILIHKDDKLEIVKMEN